MSEKTFRKHLAYICTTHPNRTSFKQSDNPFDGKPFACYHDRVAHKTYYFTDVDKARQVAKKLEAEWGRGDVKKFTQKIRVASESIDIDNSKHIIIPPKPPLAEKPVREEGLLKISKEEAIIAKEMVDVWKEKTQGYIAVPKLTTHFAIRLVSAFKEHFRSSMDLWRSYCSSIGSSNFLLGKTSSFKAWLVWVLRSDVIEKVKQGAYGILQKFVMVTATKPINAEKDVMDAIHSLNEPESLRAFREILLRKLGADSYVTWFSRAQLRIDEGRVVVAHHLRFSQQKAQELANQCFGKR